MINKIIILFKIARKIGSSNIIEIVDRSHKVPFFIKLFFNLVSLSFSKNQKKTGHTNDLSSTIQDLGTTFIKLGQFLETRPDIIGEELTKNLEQLQDQLPPFSKSLAENIIREELGELTSKNIIELSEPVAAASIAQVHKAKINDNNTIKDVAVKVLRPNIKEIFNSEIDAIMMLAYLVETFIPKTKRLKLIENLWKSYEILLKSMERYEDLRQSKKMNEHLRKIKKFNEKVMKIREHLRLFFW